MLCVCFGLATGNFACGPKTDTAPPVVPPASTPIPVSNTPTGIVPAEKQPAAKVKEKVKLQDGLEYTDVIVGTGAFPADGQKVFVHYIGTLKDGTKFDSSVDRGQPFVFELGGGQVIKGWDEGVRTMKIGGVRKLVIPPALGYGAKDMGKIPPNSTLYFDIQLMDAK